VATQPDFSSGEVSEAMHVQVMHGIFSGRFPIRGMTVGEARRVLQDLLNIQPRAIALVDGQPVDDDRTLDDEVTLLAFVRAQGVIG
jgi:hypothetical protein